MDKLEEITKEFKSEFEEINLPEGDQKRFLSKLYKSRIRTWQMIAMPIAAILLLFIGITGFVNYSSPQRQISRVYANYCKEVVSLSNEMLILTSDQENISATIENITFEAVPFVQQLPEEMSQRDKIKAMKTFYTQKLDGIRRLKTFVAESTIEIE